MMMDSDYIMFEPRVQHCHIKRCSAAPQKVAQVHPCCNALHEVAKRFCDSYLKSGPPHLCKSSCMGYPPGCKRREEALCVYEANSSSQREEAKLQHGCTRGCRVSASPGREPSASHGRWAPAPVPCSSGLCCSAPPAMLPEHHRRRAHHVARCCMNLGGGGGQFFFT